MKFRATKKTVAQTSKSAVSRISKSACAVIACAPRTCDSPTDLEVGDTAGLETCATPTLIPALSHPMGEGESHPVSSEFVSAGFAGRTFAERKTHNCCSLSRRTGEGQGEGLL
jgi:hypothetical protein